MSNLTPDDLLAGANAIYDVVVPPALVAPNSASAPAAELIVQLRPITIGTFQLIMRAARNDAGLIPLLLIKEALVEPALSLDQVKRMPLGLVNFLIEHIREISGLTEKKKPLADLAEAPLVQASYRLARAFGWTPQEVQGMTMGQIALYLQLLAEDKHE